MWEQGATVIYYVADAADEIVTAISCNGYNVVPVGFAHVITPERVAEAYARVRAFQKEPYLPRSTPEKIDPARLKLPDGQQLTAALRDSGARTVVTGSREEIMAHLRTYFLAQGALRK